MHRRHMLWAVQLLIATGMTALASEPDQHHVTDPADQPDPASVEDRALVSRLSDKGAELIAQERTTKGSELVQQLRQARCLLTLPESCPLADGPVDVYAKARGSIVVIGGLYKCQKCSKWHATTATGFFITAAGAVVTNHHVVADPKKEALVVMTADQRVLPVQRVLAASRADDLAILQVPAEGVVPLPLPASAEAAPVGSAVSVISHPGNRFFSFTAGMVSRHMKIRSHGQIVDALSITADFARGSSGAPVLNNQGQVVAIVKSTESIYYSNEAGQQKNLQMVFKICIPSRSLLQLIDRGPAPAP